MKFRTALLAIALLIAVPALAAPKASIGYVDMQQVIEQSELGQRAQARLQEEFGPQREAFAEEEQAIRTLQQQLQRDKPLMSKEQIAKRESELQERVQGFRKEASATQERLLKEQQEMSQEILAPALEAVNAIAEERSLAAVFERRQAGLVYVDDAIDLTPEVIKQLDAATE